MVTAFCMRCQEKRHINNPKLETSTNNKSVVRGTCEVCQTNVAKITSPETSQSDLNNEVKEREKEIEKEAFTKEKEEVNDYVEKSKEKKPLLKRYGYNPPMKRIYYNLIKILVFLLITIVVILAYRTLYPEEFTPSYNTNLTCESQGCVNECNCPEIVIPKCPEIVIPKCPENNVELYCGDEINGS